MLYLCIYEIQRSIFNFQAPKLNSVAGILAHLAGTHFNDVKTELYNLFMVRSVFVITFIQEHPA